jgi:hypothetical protein
MLGEKIGINMNWETFISSFIGTTIPAFIVSAVLLFLNYRTNRALEEYRKEISSQLEEQKNLLNQRSEMFSLWHQKRVIALLTIYDAFRKHLDFLRRHLYVFPHVGGDVSPIHDFPNTIQEQIVYLNDALQTKIRKYQMELLEFWNWAVEIGSKNEAESWTEVQYKLDYEIPNYLEILRKDINEFADPNLKNSSKDIL